MNREAKEGRHLKRDFFYCSGEMLFLKDGDGKGRLYLEKENIFFSEKNKPRKESKE